LTRTRVRVPGRGEAAARRARYAALHALARRHGCVALATAHTADDRAETILLNLLRGSGLRGLAAPRPRSRHDGVVRVRPALDERRETLHAAARPLDPVRDLTNRSTTATRARIRALLLPDLRRRLGVDPVPLLCALGDLAARLRADLERRARILAPAAGRDALLAEPEATFPYLVEALRGAGPPLTASAYGSLRDFLRAGRADRTHTTPAGDRWRIAADRSILVDGLSTATPRT
jgi:tRNA(Ile)-lysidine synthase TilS/MesJ